MTPRQDIEFAQAQTLIQEKSVIDAVAWLDEVRPGWHNLINLKTFDLDSVSSCVCGQVFKNEVKDKNDNGYRYAVDAFPMFVRQSDAFTGTHDYYGSEEFWNEKTDQFEGEYWGISVEELDWIFEIKARQEFPS